MPLLRPGEIKFRYFDDNGNPLANGRVWTYVSGTNTPLTTFSDVNGLVPNTNPVELDARGEANIFLSAGRNYRFTVRDANGALIETEDNIAGASPAAAAEWLNVKSFGAVGDGVSDDTLAIQDAVNAATTSPRKTLFAPAGTYRLTSGITINGRLQLVGDGVNNTTFSYTPINGDAFSWSADGSYSYLAGFTIDNAGNSRVVGQTSTAFRTATAGGAVSFQYVWERINIVGFSLYGIWINDSFSCKFSEVRINDCGVRGTLAAGGTDGQGAGIHHARVNFTGAAVTGNDYTNVYFRQCHIGADIEQGGSNQRAFNTRFDNCFAERCYIGIDMRNTGSGTIGRFQLLSAVYFENNLYAGALMDEGTNVACWQNQTVPGTGIPPSVSTDGADGIIWAGRCVEDRPGRFVISNNAVTDAEQQDAFRVSKDSSTNYITDARFFKTGALQLVDGAGGSNTETITINSGAGNPEGSVTANTGSIFLRHEGSEVGRTLYIKVQNDGTNTGWLPLGPLFGNTASRPASTSANGGQTFYDSDILRTVVSNGAGTWREYNGLTTVRDTLANIPTGINGARFYASDLSMVLMFDGTRWRQMTLPTRFGAVSNGGTTTIANRGEFYVGTTTGAAVATHTLVLPSGVNAVSGDRVRFTTSNGVTALTVSAGAATVVNAPTTMTAGQTVEFVYNDSTTTWYRVS